MKAELAVSCWALMTIAMRHKLEVIGGDHFELTKEMVHEAMAIDNALGNRPPPEKLKDLRAAMMKGMRKNDSWAAVEGWFLFDGKEWLN
jgi:hypothetical protein